MRFLRQEILYEVHQGTPASKYASPVDSPPFPRVSWKPWRFLRHISSSFLYLWRQASFWWLEGVFCCWFSQWLDFQDLGQGSGRFRKNRQLALSQIPRPFLAWLSNFFKSWVSHGWRVSVQSCTRITTESKDWLHKVKYSLVSPSGSQKEEGNLKAAESSRG